MSGGQNLGQIQQSSTVCGLCGYPYYGMLHNCPNVYQPQETLISTWPWTVPTVVTMSTADQILQSAKQRRDEIKKLLDQMSDLQSELDKLVRMIEAAEEV